MPLLLDATTQQTPPAGRCHHRVAMVLIFDSIEEAAACIEAGLVRLVPANDLNPEAIPLLEQNMD